MDSLMKRGVLEGGFRMKNTGEEEGGAGGAGMGAGAKGAEDKAGAGASETGESGGDV